MNNTDIAMHSGRIDGELPDSSKARSLKTVASASFAGTLVEWYDFFLYGTAAALVFNKLFFPTLSPLTGTLAAFATYAVGFLARPLGGIVLGHIGDRFGRKRALVFTLILMGLATFVIGLLPTYETLGIWAPVGLVLLRIVQGFGVGGEWGGAVLLVVEHAPTRWRGFFGSLAQLGVPLGMGLATIVFRIFSSLPEAQFLSWGWRVPFLLSAILVIVGLVIRARVSETPVFETRRVREPGMPLLELFSTGKRALLQATGARIAENGCFYIFSTFVITYAVQHLGLSRGFILNAITLAVAVDIVSIPLFGYLSDRFGRRPVYLLGAIGTAVFAFPFFWLINTGSGPLIYVALLIALPVLHAAMYAPQAALMAELFPTRIRYSGISLASQIASILAGALSPLLATLFLGTFGFSAIAFYMIGMAVITIVAVAWAPETVARDLNASGQG